MGGERCDMWEGRGVICGRGEGCDMWEGRGVICGRGEV